MSSATHTAPVRPRAAEYAAAQRQLGLSERKIAELTHELGLPTSETILLYIQHHWHLPVVRAIIPLLVALMALVAALYRAVGGRFLLTGLEPVRQFGRGEIITLALAGVLFYFWMRSYNKPTKKYLYIPTRWAYPAGIGLLLISFYFSYALGGRLIYFDPLYARGQDAINYGLYGIVALMLFVFWLIWVDYRDTVLVLTTERVIYNEDIWKIRLIRQQIQIADIQQVQFKQSTYPSVILGYGDVIIQSFSQRKIHFHAASGAREMSDGILNEVNKLRKNQTPETLQALLLSQIYNEKKPAPGGPKRATLPPETPREIRGPGRLIAWLFPVNPEEKPNGDILWRPAPIYIAFQIARPVLLFIALTALWIGLSRFGVPFGYVLLGFALTVLGCGGWIFWLREELVEDVYMLRPNEIVDVDKRPLGPINRRSAPLDRIQNISFDTNLIETILGYGTVKIQTGGSGEFSFNHVPDPRGVQSRINDYLSAYRKQEKARQLGDAVALIREYDKLRKTKEFVLDQQMLDDKIRAALTSYAPPAEAQANAPATQRDLRYRRVIRRPALADLIRRYLRGEL